MWPPLPQPGPVPNAVESCFYTDVAQSARANDTRYGLDYSAADFLDLSLGCSLENQRQRPAAFCSSFDISIYWVPAKVPLSSSDRNVKWFRL